MRTQIAVNTRLLLPNKLEGIGWFTYETLKRITTNHPEVDFHFFFDREFDEQFIFNSNVHPHIIYPSARHPVLFYTWFEWRLPPKLRKLKADLFLSPDGYLSLNSEKKQLAVIHDIYFEHYPQYLPLGARYYLKYYFPKFAHKANRIATVSEFSKNDIIGQYGTEADKIDVVYNGASKAFRPLSPTEKTQARDQFANGLPYFIYVGALQPRKNTASLLQAFDQFRETTDKPMKLVLTGEKKWWGKDQESVYQKMKYKADVHFLGRVEPEELSLAMGGAEALTYISFFEGFGIPILEAMRSEVPVLTSGITSMPEVGGDAAVYCSPFDIDSIVEGMKEVTNPLRRTELITAAKVQRQKFSWDLTAEKLWKSVELCLD